MRKLWNRILIKLGLREPLILVPKVLDAEALAKFETIGWKFANHSGRMNNKDFIVRGEIVDE